MRRCLPRMRFYQGVRRVAARGVKSSFVIVMAGALLCGGAPVSKAQASVIGLIPAYDGGGERHGVLQVKDEKRQNGHQDTSEGAGENHRDRIEDRLESIPPEQREEARRKFEEIRQKRQNLQTELESLSPEERKARMEELRSEFGEQNEEQREAFRQKFREQWESASDEERRSFCDNARERCAQGGGRSACATAEENCSSY